MATYLPRPAFFFDAKNHAKTYFPPPPAVAASSNDPSLNALWISASVFPLVSGTARAAYTPAARHTSAMSANAPAPKVSAAERKTKSTHAPVAKSSAVAADIAGAFHRIVNSSETITQNTPAQDALNANMNKHMAATTSVALLAAYATLRNTIATPLPNDPKTKSGFRPTRSTANMLTATPASFAAETKDAKSTASSLDSMPTRCSTRGA